MPSRQRRAHPEIAVYLTDITRAHMGRVGDAGHDGAGHRHPALHDHASQMRQRIEDWAQDCGAVCVLAWWEGRERAVPANGVRRLEKSAEAFLHDGFPPETVVRIRC